MDDDDYSNDGDVLMREQELLCGRLQGTTSRYLGQVGGRGREGRIEGTHVRAGCRGTQDCNNNVMRVRGLSVHVCPIHAAA